MPFTYDVLNLANSDKDQVRLLIGDTDVADPLLQDEEINLYLTQEGSVYGAAIQCCRSLAARFSRQSSEFKAGSVLISDKERANGFTALADSLQRKFSITSARPFAGGISKADKASREEDGDRVKPSFTRTTHIPPGETFGSVDGWIGAEE